MSNEKAPEKKAAPEQPSITTGDAHPANKEPHRPVEDERAKQGEYKKFAAPDDPPRPVDFYSAPWEQSV